MTDKEYWTEAMENILRDNGYIPEIIPATFEKIVEDVMLASEYKNEYNRTSHAGKCVDKEKEMLKREIKILNTGHVCPHCKGMGTYYESFGPTRGSLNECQWCFGKGIVYKRSI